MRGAAASPGVAAAKLSGNASALDVGFGGSVAVEQAFGVPGLGRTLVTAVIERDIIVVQNLVLFYAVIFVAVNVLVDLSYAWLDPRIRYS